MKKIRWILALVTLLMGCASAEVSQQSEEKRVEPTHTNLIVDFGYYEDADGLSCPFYAVVDFKLDDKQKVMLDVGSGNYIKEDGTVVGKQTIDAATKEKNGQYILEIYEEKSSVSVESNWLYFNDYRNDKVTENLLEKPAVFTVIDDNGNKTSSEVEFDKDSLKQLSKDKWIWEIGKYDHGKCIVKKKPAKKEETKDDQSKNKAITAVASLEKPITIDILWDDTQLKNPDDFELVLDAVATDKSQIKEEFKNGIRTLRNEKGEDLATVHYEEGAKTNNHIVVNVWSKDINMNISWSTGPMNDNNLAGCRVYVAYDGEIIDERYADKDWVQSYTGIHLLGICNIKEGVYGPYDTSWLKDEKNN